MRLISFFDGAFMVGTRTLRHRATLEDDAKPGVLNLCKDQNWELYHTAPQPGAQPIKDHRVKEAMRLLLDWHKAECNGCIELAPGSWSYCAEGQDLLAHI